MTKELDHVHEGTATEKLTEFYPPHPPREETPTYRKAHHFLIYEKKQGCFVCKVNIDTLHDPAKNPWGATDIESHHFPIERSCMDAIDPMKLHEDYPQVYDHATLEAFIDSPANLITACSVHHRHPEHGIHHVLYQDLMVEKYGWDHYQPVSTAKNAQNVREMDEKVEESHGFGAPLTPNHTEPNKIES